MNELFKSFRVIAPWHPNQNDTTIVNTDHIKKGIIFPRPLILEFTGTVDQLRTEISKHTGFSIEGVKASSKHELVDVTLKFSSFEQMQESLPDNSQDTFDFAILIQIYGQIAIPMKNLTSLFNREYLDSKL
jgi:hypothetical protein